MGDSSVSTVPPRPLQQEAGSLPLLLETAADGCGQESGYGAGGQEEGQDRPPTGPVGVRRGQEGERVVGVRVRVEGGRRRGRVWVMGVAAAGDGVVVVVVAAAAAAAAGRARRGHHLVDETADRLLGHALRPAAVFLSEAFHQSGVQFLYVPNCFLNHLHLCHPLFRRHRGDKRAKLGIFAFSDASEVLTHLLPGRHLRH